MKGKHTRLDLLLLISKAIDSTSCKRQQDYLACANRGEQSWASWAVWMAIFPRKWRANEQLIDGWAPWAVTIESMLCWWVKSWWCLGMFRHRSRGLILTFMWIPTRNYSDKGKKQTDFLDRINLSSEKICGRLGYIGDYLTHAVLISFVSCVCIYIYIEVLVSYCKDPHEPSRISWLHEGIPGRTLSNLALWIHQKGQTPEEIGGKS